MYLIPQGSDNGITDKYMNVFNSTGLWRWYNWQIYECILIAVILLAKVVQWLRLTWSIGPLKTEEEPSSETLWFLYFLFYIKDDGKVQKTISSQCLHYKLEDWQSPKKEHYVNKLFSRAYSWKMQSIIILLLIATYPLNSSTYYLSGPEHCTVQKQTFRIFKQTSNEFLPPCSSNRLGNCNSMWMTSQLKCVTVNWSQQ
jgi:hypothetical protein